MKILRTVALAVALAMPTARAAAQHTVIMGDMNGDGVLTAADVTALVSTIIGATPQRTLTVSGEAEPVVPATPHEWVDLGLPSGTLWATVNLGASAPEESGYYLSWGEAESKDAYSWATYTLCNGEQNELLKYCTNDDYGTVDGLTKLSPPDDAATAIWGSDWCMPTKEQFEEVIDERNTVASLTTRNGTSGVLIRALEGDAEIFLPAVGFKMGSQTISDSPLATYWTSSLVSDKPYRAWTAYLPVYTGSTLKTAGENRMTGRPVRAVRKQR